MDIRYKLIGAVFILAVVGLLVRLFYWQVIKAGELAGQARGQREVERFIEAPRGNILARDGSFLVAKAEAYLVYAELPRLTESPSVVANKLASFLVEDPEDKELLLAEVVRLQELLEKKEVVWVPLKPRVDRDIKANIEALAIDGIGFEKNEIRYYPEASAAAQLLGFVGKKEDGGDIGYFGLEGYYNTTLKGKPGLDQSEQNALGQKIALGEGKEISAVGGIDLLTHIDKTIQLSVEENFKEGLERYGASAGSVIVIEPKTGAILAMASYPSYDPREYWKYGDTFFKNPVISDVFEPGSVFKVIVMASALDSGVVTPETKCDVCNGPFKVDKYSIETWNNKYYPDSTMTEVIVHSDNVGMSFVSQKMGADSLYDYLDKFGIGQLTGVDLQGEVTPKLREKGTWNIVDLATMSFGQGVAVTPIQFIRAVAAIANGGIEVTPQVVGKLESSNWEHTITPNIGKRIISQKAASEITDMMVEAARYGESKWINVTNFKVAGKTGTAQIPIAGHYDADKTIASFVGFAPYDDPKFVMLVTLKEPQTSPWASETAAPLWYAIAKDLFVYLGIQPEN